jgi:hypothetical protein
MNHFPKLQVLIFLAWVVLSCWQNSIIREQNRLLVRYQGQANELAELDVKVQDAARICGALSK